MSTPQSEGVFAAFSLDAKDLTKSAINTIRATLGISGAVALIVGLFITFSPVKTAVALAWILGLYFIVAGIAYLGIGIFSKGIGGGARTLDIILGLLFVVGGIVVLANPNEAAVFLGLFLGILIGILWIVEGVVALVQSGDASSRGWAIFFGILSIVAGIVLLFSPMFILAFWWILGIALIVLGIVQIVRAFTYGKGVKV